MTRVVRIGTRGGVLSATRAQRVADLLRASHAGMDFEVVPLGEEALPGGAADHPATGGVAAGALEETLRARWVDLLVRSAEELPRHLPNDLPVAAWLERDDRRDALVVRDGVAAGGLGALPAGARVGVCAARETCLLRALHPALVPTPTRWPVPAALERLDAGELDALVVPAAALDRLGLGDRIAERLDPATFVPTPGAGALALQARADDVWTSALASTVAHEPSALLVRAERGVLSRLGLDASAPVGASATMTAEGKLRLDVLLGATDGRRAQVTMEGSALFPEILGARAADDLLGAGGAPLLALALERAAARG